jgi:alkanesulfonate monooxygenase SsuD/methylene tetrahydromethanopterin reductase-like flavin-dependent oxidoreductase (luciferase family)
MKFGVFYEHQLPRPWADGAEEKLLHEALDQVQLADELGIDFAWEVEHHFLEEYSHSSAPEVFLAAASQRTKRIRLGHGIMLMLPGYNHPARAAERIATLDLVSRGRVEWGTGMSASRAELEGFGVDPNERHAMWKESVEQAANMLVMDPYPGFQGKYFSMPPRNVLPKPAQRPHPPLWMACSNRNTIRLAAQNGMGALTFAFIDPQEARQWVDEYYDTFRRECVPIGHAVNPNIAMVAGFSCHADSEEARRRGIDGFRFSSSRSATSMRSAAIRRAAPTSGRNMSPYATSWAPKSWGAGPDASARPSSCKPRCGCSPTRASTRPFSSSRAGATATSTSASRCNASRPR